LPAPPRRHKIGVEEVTIRVTDTPVIIEPHPFRFFGKKWTEATAIGNSCAAAFARYLVEEGIEFHHEPPTEAHSAIHRFVISASPTKVRKAAERALSPGHEASAPAGADRTGDEPA
jgi:hypothetical protein